MAGRLAADQLAFRRAGEADWPLIWPMFQQVVAAADTFPYDPGTDFDAGRALWLGGPGECWAVTDPADDGLLLGSYKVGPNRPGPGSHIGTASFMVPLAGRGRGVGQAMLRHCLMRSREVGFRGVQFNAVASSNGHAVRLYEQHGFETIGVVPGGFRHPQQGFIDLLIMFCPL